MAAESPTNGQPFARLAAARRSLLPASVSQRQDPEAILRLQTALGQRGTKGVRVAWLAVATSCALAASMVLWAMVKCPWPLTYTIDGHTGDNYGRARRAP